MPDTIDLSLLLRNISQIHHPLFFWPLYTKVLTFPFFYSYSYIKKKKYWKQCSCNLVLNFQGTFIGVGYDHFLRNKYPAVKEITPHLPPPHRTQSDFYLCYKKKTTTTWPLGLKQNHTPCSQVPHVIPWVYNCLTIKSSFLSPLKLLQRFVSKFSYNVDKCTEDEDFLPFQLW